MDPRVSETIARIAQQYSPEEIAGFFYDACIIVSAPRSGSTLLFRSLLKSPDVWSIGSESHTLFAQFPALAVRNRSFESGRLGVVDARPEICEQFRLLYVALMQNYNQQSLENELQRASQQKIIFLEKTPRNSLNIPFLTTIFPKARFIYLHRDPRETISSIIEGWEIGARTGQFVTVRRLPDWPRGSWCFLLPPEWQAMKGKSLAEIAAFQWRACNEILLDDLGALDRDRWIDVSYRDLITDPGAQFARLCDFCGAETGDYLASRTAGNLPLSPSTITPPAPDKWKRHEQAIVKELPGLQVTMDRIAAMG